MRPSPLRRVRSICRTPGVRIALLLLTALIFLPAAAVAATREAATTSVRIYLVALNDNGARGPKIGCGDSVVPVTVPVVATRKPLAAALRTLIRSHTPYFRRSGLYNALYRNRLTLRRASIAGGHATVRFSGLLSLGGVCDDPRAGAQLRRTALQFPGVHSASISINGRPLRAYLSEKGG